ncbi:hypothetical protein V5O48_019205 [Marasmius crinis-equi]|uniref:Uncharacterized protein n=1 Tax=Marasmius crinis-equi TaxID=585013 RepID=A0ABR3EJ17_9AGAR
MPRRTLTVDESLVQGHSLVETPFNYSQLDFDLRIASKGIPILNQMAHHDRLKIKRLIVYSSTPHDPAKHEIRRIKSLLPSVIYLHVHQLYGQTTSVVLRQFHVNLVSLTLAGSLILPPRGTIQFPTLEKLVVTTEPYDSTMIIWVDQHVAAPQLKYLALSVDLSIESVREYVPEISRTFAAHLEILRVRSTDNDCRGIDSDETNALCLRGLKSLRRLILEACWVPHLLAYEQMTRDDFPSLRQFVLEEDWQGIYERGSNMRSWSWSAIRGAVEAIQNCLELGESIDVCFGYPAAHGEEVQSSSQARIVERRLDEDDPDGDYIQVHQIVLPKIPPIRVL